MGELEEAHIVDEDAALAAYGAEVVQLSPEGEQASYWDENTGEPLPSDLAQAARLEEIAFMQSWRVWDEVLVEECRRATKKTPLGGRWVDVNKGDATTPLIRCRYVAKEIAYKRNDDFFAATPPLEAMRLLVSHVASNRVQNLKVLVMDAQKAHLHAMAERDVYVELPPEIRRPGYCAKLRRCLRHEGRVGTMGGVHGRRADQGRVHAGIGLAVLFPQHHAGRPVHRPWRRLRLCGP